MNMGDLTVAGRALAIFGLAVGLAWYFMPARVEGELAKLPATAGILMAAVAAIVVGAFLSALGG
jgi:hypothetical protein